MLGGCHGNWGDERLLAELNTLAADRVTLAVVRRPDAPSRVVSADLVDEFLGRARSLQGATSIGQVSTWKYYCQVEIQTRGDDPLLISIATRESLQGVPIAILEDKVNDNRRIGFYVGGALYAWLEKQGICAQHAGDLSG